MSLCDNYNVIDYDEEEEKKYEAIVVRYVIFKSIANQIQATFVCTRKV